MDHVLSTTGAGVEADLLKRSRNELDRLSELVEPLLRWSTDEGGLRLRGADISQVVREAVETVRLDPDAGPTIVVAPGPVMAQVDPPQLRTAIVNLVRNAVERSPDGRSVVVTVSRVGDEGNITVEDRGPGVWPAERERIFEPFVRGANNEGGRRGSGLGLYLSRRIIEAHGGSVRADGSAGKTTFRVGLPLELFGRQLSAS